MYRILSDTALSKGIGNDVHTVRIRCDIHGFRFPGRRLRINPGPVSDKLPCTVQRR